MNEKLYELRTLASSAPYSLLELEIKLAQIYSILLKCVNSMDFNVVTETIEEIINIWHFGHPPSSQKACYEILQKILTINHNPILNKALVDGNVMEKLISKLITLKDAENEEEMEKIIIFIETILRMSNGNGRKLHEMTLLDCVMEIVKNSKSKESAKSLLWTFINKNLSLFNSYVEESSSIMKEIENSSALMSIKWLILIEDEDVLNSHFKKIVFVVLKKLSQGIQNFDVNKIRDCYDIFKFVNAREYTGEKNMDHQILQNINMLKLSLEETTRAQKTEQHDFIWDWFVHCLAEVIAIFSSHVQLFHYLIKEIMKINMSASTLSLILTFIKMGGNIDKESVDLIINSNKNGENGLAIQILFWKVVATLPADVLESQHLDLIMDKLKKQASFYKRQNDTDITDSSTIMYLIILNSTEILSQKYPSINELFNQILNVKIYSKLISHGIMLPDTRFVAKALKYANNKSQIIAQHIVKHRMRNYEEINFNVIINNVNTSDFVKSNLATAIKRINDDADKAKMSDIFICFQQKFKIQEEEICDLSGCINSLSETNKNLQVINIKKSNEIQKMLSLQIDMQEKIERYEEFEQIGDKMKMALADEIILSNKLQEDVAEMQDKNDHMKRELEHEASELKNELANLTKNFDAEKKLKDALKHDNQEKDNKIKELEDIIKQYEQWAEYMAKTAPKH